MPKTHPFDPDRRDAIQAYYTSWCPFSPDGSDDDAGIATMISELLHLAASAGLNPRRVSETAARIYEWEASAVKLQRHQTTLEKGFRTMTSPARRTTP